MQFDRTSIQTEIRALAKKFAQNELAPHIEEDEKKERFRPEMIDRLGALGLAGIPVAEAYGGAGLGYQEYTTALEEIARVSAGYAISVAVTGLPQVILGKFGSEAQKTKYIPPLAQGKQIGGFSLSEPSSGSDAGSLLTTARKEGEKYILNGTKQWVTQGDVASTFILMARTGGPGPKGVSAFIVENKFKGFATGKREKKMGMHVSHTMELVLQNLEVPAENLVGKEGEGFKVALSALDGGRITIAATALGVAKAAYDVAVKHSLERSQFGKPISEFQGVSFMLADMLTLIESSDLLIQRAAWLRDQGLEFSREAAIAKLFTTDAAMKITTDAVQILGGSGYTQDFPVERYMREAKVMQIVEGTNQVQRLVIARSLLQSAKQGVLS